MSFRTLLILLTTLVSAIWWGVGGFHFGFDELLIVTKDQDAYSYQAGINAPFFCMCFSLVLAIMARLKERADALSHDT